MSAPCVTSSYLYLSEWPQPFPASSKRNSILAQERFSQTRGSCGARLRRRDISDTGPPHVSKRADPCLSVPYPRTHGRKERVFSGRRRVGLAALQEPVARDATMDARRWIESWPAYRQVAERDWLGLGAAVKSERSERLAPRVRDADNVVKSVCPYCAVGCGQDVYVQDGRVTQIEGDPDSPVSRGRLCPKGSASLQLTTGEARQYRVRYRRPFGTDWEDLDLDTAMDMER